MKHALLFGVLVASMSTATADEARALVVGQCAACHALTLPDERGPAHLWSRQGPDLHYAGNKFRQDWLEAWLQAPQRIRPAGVLYSHVVQAGADGDTIDTGKLTAHPRLDAEQARAAAAYLMTLTSAADQVTPGAFKGERVSPTMGRMFFNKLRGCGACHTAGPGSSGLSGPELATAGARLQADFVYAYVRDPQAFEPGVWMPRLELGEPDLQRLTGYLMQLNSDGDQP